jgi:phosphoglycolate phosphatase-like HAD superfamily hydrolase
LLDSDAALAAPYVALGVPLSSVTYGHVVADECRRLGLSLDDYVSLYDVSAAQPFDGVDAVVRSLPSRWAVCSNKVRRCGLAELARLGWSPSVAFFAEDFGFRSKRLAPVLAALAVEAGDVIFVGDSAHDRQCAADAGVRFALAAWNPRAAAIAGAGDLVLSKPSDLLELLSA